MSSHQREITIWFNGELRNRLSATLWLNAFLTITVFPTLEFYKLWLPQDYSKGCENIDCSALGQSLLQVNFDNLCV